MPEWPVRIRTPENDLVEVDFTPSGRVYLFTSYQGAWLNEAKVEEVAQAISAATWAAREQVTHD